MSNPSSSTLYLVYDGECPLCSATARMYRLRKSVGDLVVVDARTADDTALMREIAERGLDLNQGIVAGFGGRLYHGPDALHLLAMLGSDNGLANRLNVLLFRNRTVVGFAYPFMKAARNAVLKLMGRKPI
jgi:predicted DCC family thiol-disulfide oxidoreductase YuxK